MKNMGLVVVALVVLAFGARWATYDETLTGCEPMGSKYDCTYLLDKAKVRVYITKAGGGGDTWTDIGTASGVTACAVKARKHLEDKGLSYNADAYKCGVLSADGLFTKEHHSL